MKLGNRYQSAGAVAVLIAALVASLPVAAQGKDELWEVSSKMEMPGMPMAMPAQVNRVCVGKNRKDEDLVPRQSNCRVVDSKRVGSKFTYKMECTGNEPMTMLGEMTFGTNAYDGQMRMTMTKTKDTMNMAVSGKRVGDCTAPTK
jgi:Protein of unknown function (DUF3617)